jgi:hypothetical protein
VLDAKWAACYRVTNKPPVGQKVAFSVTVKNIGSKERTPDP